MDHPSLMAAQDRMAMLDRAKRNPNEILNLCPCGCSVQRLDDKGYCRHLIGWTVDGQTVELREKFGSGHERTGNLLGVVEEDDILISGTPFRKDKNGNHTPTPTYRVYRKSGKAPIVDDGKQIRREEGRDVAWEKDEEFEDAAAAV